MLLQVLKTEFLGVLATVDCNHPRALTEALCALRQRWMLHIERGLAGGFLLRPGSLPLRANARWFRVVVPSGMCVRDEADQLATVVGGLPRGTVFQAGMVPPTPPPPLPPPLPSPQYFVTCDNPFLSAEPSR